MSEKEEVDKDFSSDGEDHQRKNFEHFLEK